MYLLYFVALPVDIADNEKENKVEEMRLCGWCLQFYQQFLLHLHRS